MGLLIGILLMLGEEKIAVVILICRYTVVQGTKKICERETKKWFLSKNRLLLWGQGTDFGAKLIIKSLAEIIKGHPQMLLFLFLPEDFSHLRIDFLPLQLLSHEIPPHNLQIGGVFHICAERVLLNLEMEMRILIVFVRNSAYPDISESGSRFHRGSDRDIGRYAGEV